MIKNLEQYEIVKESEYTKDDLVNFEKLISEHWELGKIKGPVHLSDGNEEPLIEIFKRVKKTDWVFSTWRSHYHALLKGISPSWLEDEILAGKSITICNIPERFYASAIVGGILPIALGVAKGIKISGGDEKVWCCIGDMTFESGLFYEVHKYARRHDLPLHFIIEDNDKSTNTPTLSTWKEKREVPEDVIYYKYDSKYPHYGTGKWINF